MKRTSETSMIQARIASRWLRFGGRSGLSSVFALLIGLAAACGSADREPRSATSAADAPPSHAVSPHGPPSHGGHSHPPPSEERASIDDDLRRVEAIHGGAGPWAVAGYRMGQFALRKLGLERASFDIEVHHRSPREVQFSCIADGAAAATGASVGKLNLTLEDADREHVQTVYLRRSTGQSVVLRGTGAFAARFRDVPREDLGRRGREVMLLRDEEIFEEVR